MDVWEYWKEENDGAGERYALSMERIRMIPSENTVQEPYRDYFVQVSGFICLLGETVCSLQNGCMEKASLEELQQLNHRLYRDILPDHYQESYGNPAYASAHLGEVFGPLLSFLYSELRSQIPNVFEGRLRPIAAACETFIEIYNLFGESIPQEKEGREGLDW